MFVAFKTTFRFQSRIKMLLRTLLNFVTDYKSFVFQTVEVIGRIQEQGGCFEKVAIFLYNRCNLLDSQLTEANDFHRRSYPPVEIGIYRK